MWKIFFLQRGRQKKCKQCQNLHNLSKPFIPQIDFCLKNELHTHFTFNEETWNEIFILKKKLDIFCQSAFLRKTRVFSLFEINMQIKNFLQVCFLKKFQEIIFQCCLTNCSFQFSNKKSIPREKRVYITVHWFYKLEEAFDLSKKPFKKSDSQNKFWLPSPPELTQTAVSVQAKCER